MSVMKHRAVAAAICLGLASLAAPARAISVGMVDTFAAGANFGWHVGGSHPSPPEVIDGGGPGGSGDSFLLLTSVGGNGPGGRLAVIAGAGWNGDYLTAGVTSIQLDAINQGDSALQLRLYFNSAAGSAMSSVALALPAGEAWTHLVFPIATEALAGVNLAATLHSVTELRLFHNPDTSFPPSPVTAMLGIDNVAAAAAVPEPGTPWLWAVGAGALLLPALRRHARRQPDGASKPLAGGALG